MTYKQLYIIEESNVTRVDHPGNSFVIFASSISILSSRLTFLRESLWWCSNGFFLVINNNFDGCKVAGSFLHVLWMFNILQTIFLCYNFEYQLELYTFNPYNNFAPKLWHLISSEKWETHSWVLFKQSLERSVNFSRKFRKKNLVYA